jgi:hypothetical protein
VGLVLVRQVKLVNTPILPGVVSDDTDLAAKGRYTNADKVAFRGGRPQTIGGWSAFNASGVASGKARGMHAWTTLDGLPVVAAASESAMYAWINGSRTTITPKWADVWLEDPFSSTSGSATYTCTWAVHTVSTGGVAAASNHYLQVGDVVTFSNAKVTVGARSMNISATITAVPTTTTFQFTHPTGTANATTSLVGDEVLVTVAYRAGLATGTGDTAATRPRVWSLDNFGEELVAVASDGSPLFMWQPETAYSELITNGSLAADSDWATGTGWAIAAGVATHTSGTATSNLSQAVTGVLEGGRLYELSFTTTAYTNSGSGRSLDVLIDSTQIFPKLDRDQITDDATMTWTARFVCPASPTNLIFTANTTADVSIDDVSVKLVGIASPVNEAPQKSYAMFVDANRIVHLLGTVEADGDFNALCDRWSDQDNYREWVPDTTNLAGEFPLGRGSYLVGGGVVGERNLLLTDDTAYSMQFTGNSGSVYAISPVASGCGLIGRNALATYSGRAFWVSKNGFHSYDGAQIQTIECPVRNRLFGYLPQYQENKTFSWVNIPFGEWWIHYPHSSDGTETSRYLAFNFIEERNPWSVGTFNRTAMVRAGTFQYPIGVDTSGNIWYHEYGTAMTGTGITLPFIETGWLTGADGDKWVGCRRYVPDFEEQDGNIEFTISFKRRPQGQLNTTTYGPFLCREGQERIDFLGRGRQMKLRWESVPTTTKWRLGIVGLEILLDQERH